ncbi:MAG: glutamate formimidoyltransferase [Anaerolineae bacterium]
MRQIVECAPNFSEGRRQDVVDAIVRAIEECGVRVLAVSSDPERNRTSVRFIGDPDAVSRAAFAGVAAAAQDIDMAEHTGDYPRIGACDVVPLVPLVGVTMDECVALAGRLGERIGGELGLPVYLYGEAATRPERRDIGAVREGEYEGLKGVIGTDSSRAPDFGPAEMGAGGATAVGARWPFVVYTLVLDTADVDVAAAVAAALDHGSGGLADVSALARPPAEDGGARVEARVTRPDTTPLERVLAVAEVESAAHGAAVRKATLDGLVPQSVLASAAARRLKLAADRPPQTIERALLESETPDAEEDVLPRGYVSAVSSESPTPGGDSAAAVTASLGAALAGMVAALTIGQPKYADVESAMRDLRGRASGLQDALLELAAADSDAYEKFTAATGMPRGTAEENDARREAIELAVRAAIESPLDVMRRGVDMLRLAKMASESGNLSAVGDSGVAGYLGSAAVQGASLSVESNVVGLRDLEEGDRYRREAEHLLREALELAADIDRTVRERMKG